jgi:hypothetical protein
MHLTGPIISSSIQQHEQQQMNVTETQAQKLEHLEEGKCSPEGRAVAKEPQPSEYGLDEEVIKFFSSMPRTMESSLP